MARIELRDCFVRFKDGFGGSAAVNDPDSDLLPGDSVIEIDTVANLTNFTDLVPVGARFTITGETGLPVHTVIAQHANEKQSVTIDATAGTFTLKLGATGDPSDPIAYDADAAAVLTAMLASDDFVSGDLKIWGTNPNFVFEFKGNYLDTDVDLLIEDEGSLTGTVTVAVVEEGATATCQLTFTPVLASAPADNAVITFLPQQIEIKVGDGNITYTEHRTYEYMLDRGDLDTVREGDEVPLDVRLECTYEHITTGTSEAITPMDALKGAGGAAGWVSSSADPCEPYAIDIEVEHVPPCGGAQKETTLFPDFRADTKEVNYKDATISLTGKCNVIEPEVTRADA
jgi:hypothetical protein